MRINFAQRFGSQYGYHLYHHPTFDTQWWIEALRKAIPQASQSMKSGDNDSADYALVWHPPVEMLAGRDLKAVFALGAGVDSILQGRLQAHPEMLNPSVPLFHRAGKIPYGRANAEYAVSQVLHWFDI